jgi:hypothetical protein
LNVDKGEGRVFTVQSWYLRLIIKNAKIRVIASDLDPVPDRNAGRPVDLHSQLQELTFSNDNPVGVRDKLESILRQTSLSMLNPFSRTRTANLKLSIGDLVQTLDGISESPPRFFALQCFAFMFLLFFLGCHKLLDLFPGYIE